MYSFHTLIPHPLVRYLSRLTVVILIPFFRLYSPHFCFWRVSALFDKLPFVHTVGVNQNITYTSQP